MAKRRISGRALRFLFASGVLRGKGSGKKRTVTYDKKRAGTIARNRKRGVDVTSRKKAGQVNKSGRHVFGGSKAARLRSGGAPGRRVPSKAERDATRKARIGAGEGRLRELQLFSPTKMIQGRRGGSQWNPSQSPATRGQRMSMIEGKRRQVGMMREIGRRQAAEAAQAAFIKTPGKSRADRITAARMKLDNFWESRRGERVGTALGRAETKLGASASSRDINRFRLRQERAERTLSQIKRSGNFTYNGWRGGKDAQRKRYALLKDRERRVRQKYGL